MEVLPEVVGWEGVAAPTAPLPCSVIRFVIHNNDLSGRGASSAPAWTPFLYQSQGSLPVTCFQVLPAN